ncbi:MAG: hypothetical protein U9N55_04435 [candidate division Zixibacteria bacterium]|nr:hypothetical protein [candidate division Zixibacteria bacterium]
MINRVTTIIILLAAVMLTATESQATTVSMVSFQKHQLHITLDIPSHTAQITDKGTLETTQGWNMFYINHNAVIDSLFIGNRSLEYMAVAIADTAQLPSDIRNILPGIEPEGDPQLVFFQLQQGGIFAFRMSYKAEFTDDVSNTRFSNEMVGREVSGTILERGAYLSPSSYYYPQGDENSFQCVLTANVPYTWESVSDGNRLANKRIDNRKEQTWENPFESDGVMFMAAPYVTRSKWIDSIEVACYFFKADTGLIDGYLDATIGYISMYSELIGPYPYQRFTVAENFFPTGYGMPAWTLLGQQVIRLPFIKRTSLGHEVLHNWWGNSVYVDYDRGNWCEGSTVYGADYRYKLMRSSSDAQAYRKNILKQYVSFVNEQNDFPVREFISRTSPNTRTIGYNKAMMIFHMIEGIIGTDAFFDAWKRLYSDYKGKYISWEEWIDTFEKTSKTDLSYIIPQWIDKPGAPIIDIRIDKNVSDNDNKTRTVTFTLLENSKQEYQLKVPLQFKGAVSSIDTFVVLDSPESTYVMTVPINISSVSVDPKCNLFRKLYPEEIEPIISTIMGNPKKRFISFETENHIDEQFIAFCENFTDDSVIVLSSYDFPVEDSGYFTVVLNSTELPAYLKERVHFLKDSVAINSETFPREGHTFVLSGQNWPNIKKYLIIVTTDGKSLPRLGKLVPHYGKYSFLVFEGTHNVSKGNWNVEKSPLTREL